jgi:predicted lipase
MINDKIVRSGHASKYIKELRNNVILPYSVKLKIGHQVKPQAIVWERDQRSYLVAFRGNVDMMSLNDMQTDKFNFTDKCVHVQRRVLNSFSSWEDAITDAIKDAKSVTFTGHDFGGALAIFASAYYAHLFENLDVQCHTFGASRVGDDRFMEWYRTGVGDSANLSTPFDIVPQFPVTLTPCVDIVLDARMNILKSHDINTYLNIIAQKNQNVR